LASSFFFKQNASSEESDEESEELRLWQCQDFVETPTSAWSLENASTVFSVFQMRTSTRAWMMIPDAIIKIPNTITIVFLS